MMGKFGVQSFSHPSSDGRHSNKMVLKSFSLGTVGVLKQSQNLGGRVYASNTWETEISLGYILNLEAILDYMRIFL